MFRLLKWFRVWPDRKSPNDQDQSQVIRTVNGLDLPVVVVDLINAGRWEMPADPALRGRVFEEHFFVGGKFSGGAMLYSPAQMQLNTSGWLDWATESPDLFGTPNIEELPGDIDPAFIVLIGDVGTGLDSPFALDYRVSLSNPSVVHYRYKDGAKVGTWIRIAPSIQTFVDVLELKC